MDLGWFDDYYQKFFPEGKVRAKQRLKASLNLLCENPKLGRRAIEKSRAQEFSVQKTPFALLYRVDSNRLVIMRLFDQRSDEYNIRVSSPNPPNKWHGDDGDEDF